LEGKWKGIKGDEHKEGKKLEKAVGITGYPLVSLIGA